MHRLLTARALLLILLLGGSRSAIHAQTDLDPHVARAVPAVRSAYEAIHRHPELGLQEEQTAKLVETRLRALGFTTFVKAAKLPTAVIAVLDTGRPGRVRCLRAELDARPTQEKTGLPYRSAIDGRMHNCGHDAHTAILLGAAEVLMKQRAELTGKIVFLFQPAEEVAGGADDIVADGALDRLGVQAVYALHAAPGLPVGAFQLSPGPVLAGSNSLDVTVTGKGSHAAFPHEGDDVVIATAKIAAGLTTLPARKLDVVARPCVISVAYFNAGDPKSRNVLPTTASFGGTLRSYEDIDRRFEGQPSIRELAEGYVAAAAQAQQLKATVTLKKGSPPTLNDEALYDATLKELRAAWPAVKIEASRRGMAAEDFSYYTAKYPCLYFSWGIAKDEFGSEGVHTDKFTIHPDAFAYGIKLMALLGSR